MEIFSPLDGALVPTPERMAELHAEIDAKNEADRLANEERAAHRRHLDDVRRERAERPHYELATRCAGCAAELIVEVPQPYCDDCK